MADSDTTLSARSVLLHEYQTFGVVDDARKRGHSDGADSGDRRNTLMVEVFRGGEKWAAAAGVGPGDSAEDGFGGSARR